MFRQLEAIEPLQAPLYIWNDDGEGWWCTTQLWEPGAAPKKGMEDMAFMWMGRQQLPLQVHMDALGFLARVVWMDSRGDAKLYGGCLLKLRRDTSNHVLNNSWRHMANYNNGVDSS